MISIPLFLAEDHVCSYLEDQVANSIFVHPSFKLNTSIYNQLIAKGFRRSGDLVYAPHCQSCFECKAARIPVAQFKPNRSQKRCLTKNINTQIILKPARFDHSHYELYLRYQNSRHNGGNMAQSSPSDYMEFLGSNWCNTQFVEFHIKKQLSAVAIIDRLDNALSAVYTFFDPDLANMSPGVFAVLWQIHWAQKLNLKWVYLGFWIKNCQKMNYKTDYQPLELLINKQWLETKTIPKN